MRQGLGPRNTMEKTDIRVCPERPSSCSWVAFVLSNSNHDDNNNNNDNDNDNNNNSNNAFG